MAKRLRRKKHTPTPTRTHAPPDLKMVWVDPDILKDAAYNPRTHSDEQERHLTESIKNFSIVEPIVVNGAPGRKNIVIGGHFRLKVLRKLGYRTVPVVYVHISSLEREKELNIRLNKNVGEWDWDLLKEFNMDTLLDVGFQGEELSKFFDGMLETEDDQFDVEKELAAIKKPKTKPGDRIVLGDHVLLCGDATKLEDVKRLVGRVQPEMIYCDPPYNLSLDYDKGLGGKMRYGGKTNDSKTEEQYREFLRQTLENALAVSKKDVHLFYWCDENWVWLLQVLFQELHIKHQRLCAWVKGNFSRTPQIAFNKGMEMCVYGTVGKPYLSPSLMNLHELLNKEIGSGSKAIEDVIDLFSIWLQQRLHSAEYTHPAEKPPTLHEKSLRRCTKPGDTVLDLFGGSGSTLVACHQMKRKCFLMEIEPCFCDLIIKRAEALGLKPSVSRP